MARLAPLDLDSLTPEQKEVADAIRNGPRGGMRGPFEAWLRAPGLADVAQKLGAYCRFGRNAPSPAGFGDFMKALGRMCSATRPNTARRTS